MTTRKCDCCLKECELDPPKLTYYAKNTEIDMGRYDLGPNRPGICLTVVFSSDTKGQTADLCGKCVATIFNEIVKRGF